MFARLGGEVKALIDEVVELSYFMRGAATYDDILTRRTAGERKAMAEFIKNRLEVELKKQTPVY